MLSKTDKLRLAAGFMNPVTAADAIREGLQIWCEDYKSVRAGIMDLIATANEKEGWGLEYHSVRQLHDTPDNRGARVPTLRNGVQILRILMEN